MSRAVAAALVELFDPTQRAKRYAIDTIRPFVAARAARIEPWWAWTAWMAYAITVRRIEHA